MAGERITVRRDEFEVKKDLNSDQAMVTLLKGIQFITTIRGARFLRQSTRVYRSVDVILGATTPPRAEVIQRSRSR